MGEYKLQPNLYSLTDTDGMECRLEAMSPKGWQLVSAGPYVWRYRREAAAQRRYQIVFASREAYADPEDVLERRTVRQVWEAAGWQFVSGFAGLQVFCTDDPEAQPVPEDPAIRLQAIHSCVKRRSGMVWLFLAAIALFGIGSAALTYSADPVELLADGPHLITLLILLVLAVYAAWDSIRYCLWHSRAEKQLTGAGSIPQRKGACAIRLVALAVVLGLLTWLLIVQQPYERMVTVADLFAYIAVFAAIAITRRVRRSDRSDRKSRAISLATVVIVVALLVGMVESVIIDYFRPQQSQSDLLLTVSELTGERYEESYSREEIQRSAFLEDMTQYQSVASDGNQHQLQYRITKVKAQKLTQLCRENCLPARLWDLVTEEDPTAWNAERAWLKVSEDGKYLYYLYYSDRTVTLMLNWEPTAEQIAHLADRFQCA